jgi:hypothetical protein
VAAFSRQASPVKAWFDYQGNWTLSQTSISYNSLNTAASQALAQSAYAGYGVVSASLLERNSTAAIYLIKISSNSEILNVYVSLDGHIIRTRNSTATELETPLSIPSGVTRTMDAMFDNFRVLDFWSDSFGSKAAIDDSGMYRLVSFDQDNQWVATFWDLQQEDVPAEVADKFAHSSYGHSTVDQVRVMENAQKSTFLFYFTHDGKNKIASIDMDASCMTILTY